MRELTSTAARRKPATKQRNEFDVSRDRFRDQIYSNNELPNCALRVGWAISTLFNRELYGTEHVLTSWPGTEWIGRKVNMHRRGVLRGIRALCAGGHIRIIKGGRGGRSNTYVAIIRGAPQLRVIEGDKLCTG